MSDYVWKRGVERRNTLGERVIVDVLRGPGGHDAETRFIRKLGASEVWPPPAPVDPAVTAAKAAEVAAVQARQGRITEMQQYLIGPNSHLGKAEKEELRRQIEWRERVGG